MEILYETNNEGIGLSTTKASQKLHIVPRSSWRALCINGSTNDLDPIGVPKTWKPKLGIRKSGGSDIEWFNPCGDQATHFTNCTESPNVKNSNCKCKKTRITFDVGPTTCVYIH